MFEAVTQLNCGPVTLEKFIKPRGWRWNAKVLGTRHKRKPQLLKWNRFSLWLKILFSQALYFHFNVLLALTFQTLEYLDCHSRCLNGEEPAPRRCHSGIPYLEKLVAHRGKKFSLARHFPFHACPFLRTCVRTFTTCVNLQAWKVLVLFINKGNCKKTTAAKNNNRKNEN